MPAPAINDSSLSSSLAGSGRSVSSSGPASNEDAFPEVAFSSGREGMAVAHASGTRRAIERITPIRPAASSIFI